MLYKRKDSPYYWYKFKINKRTVQRSTGTSEKEKAQKIADKAKADAWDLVNETYSYSWEQAVTRWMNESDKRSLSSDTYMIQWLEPYLGDKNLNEIDNKLIEKIIQAKLKETGKTRVNRITTLIGSILNKAKKEWNWTNSVPHIRKFKEPSKRVRWITREEALRLMRILPDHMEAMARFNLATGLRMRNITHLEWEQVDMQRKVAWIHSDQIKNDKALSVPLNKDAIRVLRQQIGKHSIRVFTYRGNPIDNANTRLFRRCLKEAGIESFRWHDFRHTWASWLVQSGCPLHVLKEMGGWSSMDMVMKYAHLSSEHLAGYSEMVSFKTDEFKLVRNGDVC